MMLRKVMMRIGVAKRYASKLVECQKEVILALSYGRCEEQRRA